MTQKQIEVCVNKKTKPEAVFLGNQHENNATRIKFVIDPALLRAGYFYYVLLVSPDKSVQYAIGLADYTFEVSSAVTKYAGEWEMHVLIKDTEMVDGNVSEGLVFISNNIIGFVKENALDLEDMEEQPLPEGFQIIYDDLLEATKEANETYEKLMELSTTLNRLVNLEGFLENYFALRRTGKIYSVKFYKYETSTSPLGEKLNANAELVCEPSTNMVAGRDDYADIPLFACVDCNFTIDENGDKHPTFLQGQEGFARTGKVDVGVLQMSAYWAIEDHDTYFIIHYSDLPNENYNLQPYPDCIRADGSIAPYMIHSKYISGEIDGVLYSSSGLKPYRNNSYANMQTNYKKKGSGYTGVKNSEQLFRYVMTMLKYATKNEQTVMYGCNNWNFQYKVAKAESDVKRIVVAKAQAANMVVGGYISIGDPGSESSLDRGQSYMHNIADDVRIISIESLDDTNSAVYVDTPTTFTTTATTYVSSMHYHSGSCDNVLGSDGSPGDNTSGKYPMKVQGIECRVGGYEVAGDVVIDITSTTTRDFYVATDINRYNDITTIKQEYKKVGTMSGFSNNTWIGDIQIDQETGVYFPKTKGTGDSVGVGDMYYQTDADTTGQREYLQGGSLWGGGFGGPAFLNGGGSLSYASWFCLARV